MQPVVDPFPQVADDGFRGYCGETTPSEQEGAADGRHGDRHHRGHPEVGGEGRVVGERACGPQQSRDGVAQVPFGYDVDGRAAHQHGAEDEQVGQPHGENGPGIAQPLTSSQLP